jgi:hypothetical protein
MAFSFLNLGFRPAAANGRHLVRRGDDEFAVLFCSVAEAPSHERIRPRT